MQFSDLWVELEAPQVKDYPMVFTDITVTYHISGKGIKEADLARAIELSEDKSGILRLKPGRNQYSAGLRHPTTRK